MQDPRARLAPKSSTSGFSKGPPWIRPLLPRGTVPLPEVEDFGANRALGNDAGSTVEVCARALLRLALQGAARPSSLSCGHRAGLVPWPRRRRRAAPLLT